MCYCIVRSYMLLKEHFKKVWKTEVYLGSEQLPGNQWRLQGVTGHGQEIVQHIKPPVNGQLLLFFTGNTH